MPTNNADMTVYAEFERKARDALAKHLKVDLHNDEININGKWKRFDIVNKSQRIVGDVKNYKTTSGGNRPSAKFSTLNEYCWLMQMAEKYNPPGTWRKMFVIGEDKEMVLHYVKEFDAWLDDIEIYYFSNKNGIEKVR